MVDIDQTAKENAEAILRAFINENFPEIETRKGSAFRSLVISPAASFYALMQAENTSLKNSQSLANLDTETVDESVLEALISNFMVTRKPGNPSKGTLKIVASINKEYIVPATTEFLSPGDVVFSPEIDYSFKENPENLVGVGELFKESDGQFYFLLPVVSKEPSDVVVSQDEVFTLNEGSFVDNRLVSIVSNAPFTEGTSKETISQYKDRALESISTRDLVTNKSISTLLRDTFTSVYRVQVTGYGDNEMLRDLMMPYGIHKGGTVDVYVRQDQTPELISLERQILDNASVTLTGEDTPVLSISSVSLKVGESLTPLVEGTDYTLEYSSSGGSLQSFSLNSLNDYAMRFSQKENILVKFIDASLSGRKVVVSYYKSSSVSAIQTYLDSEENRVICADLLVKAFAPVYVTIPLTYRVEANSEIPSEDEIKTALKGYINNLTGLDAPDTASIVSIVTSFPGIKGVALPLNLEASIHKTDGGIETIQFNDKLVIPEKKSIGFSQKICQYILLDSAITLTKEIV